MEAKKQELENLRQKARDMKKDLEEKSGGLKVEGNVTYTKNPDNTYYREISVALVEPDEEKHGLIQKAFSTIWGWIMSFTKFIKGIVDSLLGKTEKHKDEKDKKTVIDINKLYEDISDKNNNQNKENKPSG